MSDENEAVDTCCCCASCGIAEIDDITLMSCDGCDLVRYCSDECREDHKSVHEEECKKRAAEVRDELLFKQPENNHLGDCPICSLPMPLNTEKTCMHSCCSKVICLGCDHANVQREKEMRLQNKCAFCRKPIPKTKEEREQRRRKRVEANDPVAIYHEGEEQYWEGDYSRAFKYFAKAAELGDAMAHYRLSTMYNQGYGVEQNEGKEIHHLEEAAIGGHPKARYNLGGHEFINGNAERMVKHLIIAATLGHDDAIKALIAAFKDGQISKETLASALRAHKAAVDATKSPQRVTAERIFLK